MLRTKKLRRARAEGWDTAGRVVLAVAEKPPVTAGSFRELVTIAKQVVNDDAVAAKHLAALERLRQIEAMSLEHLDKQVWVTLLDRAQAAAAQGESSFELIRFPCDICSDGGRKIDVAEIDWPSTLRGEAAEVDARWERELRPVVLGFVPKLWSIWTESQTSPCLSPRPLLNPAK
ncbi:MAG: hypothetical protein WB715_18800 [Roseiarcus sp.]|uniref:hypothetical protein n=1 Tax=Roseiarcus sp. TaxID=1969460 RepID=UPI003C62FAF9